MRRIIALGLACAWLTCCGFDPSLAHIDNNAPVAPAALSVQRRSPAAYATADGWVIHGVALTPNDLARWAPIVTFHPQEAYLPCSADDLLRHATVMDAAGHALLHAPAQQDLYRLRHIGDHLVLDADATGGSTMDARLPVQAPMYVSAQVPKDGAFVDLNYIFLTAFNGSQTGVLKLFGLGTELTLPHFADHQGDIEGITVRVSADLQRVILVRFEGHGHSQFVKPDQADFVGTHVRVLSALNSHANYNARAFAGHRQHLLARVSALGFGLNVVDITDTTGPTWAPFAMDGRGTTHDVGQLRFVGLDEHDEPLSDQAWASFAGRLGDTWINTFAGVRRPDGTQLNFALRTCANGLVSSAIRLGKTRGFTLSAGPVGLAARCSARAIAPCWTPPEGF